MGFRVAAGVLLLVAGLAARASACECVTSREPGAACEYFFQADAVFVGLVQSISSTTSSAPLHQRLVTLVVERALRGVQAPSVEVVTGNGGGDCGYPFKPGERYLVYANANGRALATSICSRTRPLAAAASDLRAIDALPPDGTGARVFGTVGHTEYDMANDRTRAYPPVALAQVTLHGSAGDRETQTDQHGEYTLTDLPVGEYEAQIVPPAPFQTSYLRRRIKLSDPRACAQVDFSVRYDGRISGIAVGPDGQAVPAGIRIDAIAVERIGTRGVSPTLSAITDARGRFEFQTVSPGRYVVGVALGERRPDAIYPTTYYPGTPSADRATIIEVGEGTQHLLDVFQLPAWSKEVPLGGIVVDADGQPVSGATVWVWDPDAPLTRRARTDANGRFEFTVRDGRNYLVQASLAAASDRSLRPR